MCGDVAAALRTEARATNERRVLVLAGARDAAGAAARNALAAAEIPPDETTLLSERPVVDCERLPRARSGDLLGRTRTAVVLDCHDACQPNALGRAVGAVDGGGLLLVLTPPLEEWPERRDAFDERLAVPPRDVADVAGNFRRRLVATLRAHRGVAIVDADTGTVERDGLTGATGPPRASEPPEPPADPQFPLAAYDACLTADQADAVAAMEALGGPGTAVVVEADRGRGKSSAAGIAAGALAAAGRDVLVTAPQYRSAREVFARAAALLETLDGLAATDGDPPRCVESDAGGRVRFVAPGRAVDLPGDPDCVVVDEAAALPVRRLEAFLDAPSVAYATTVHGYEGAGRGFSVRFRDRLAASDHDVRDVSLADPIRYAAGDPVEVWAFRALLLDARPPVDQLVADATPETVAYEALTPDRLLADETLLREAFGLLVLAHYRTEPDDLARVLDAPNLSVRALTHGGEPSDARRASSDPGSDGGHVVAVALLAREGGLPAETRRRMYEGERTRGNMVPDLLTAQLRDEDAGVPEGMRVVRIATHHAVRSRGLGSRLLSAIGEEFSGLDWLGSGFGATPELLAFWRANGYGSVHLSTSRNDASGEYSALVLRPLSDAGRALHDRHARRFARRVGSMLADPLRDADPDVVRAVLHGVDAPVEVDLSTHEWTFLAGAGSGPAHLATNPRPFRRLAVKHLVDPADPDALDATGERLLVARVLQARPAEDVADLLGFHSGRETMRALGRAVETLVRLYGPPAALEELERHA
jgi:tRNA(Met) cytidine acetyltransferase